MSVNLNIINEYLQKIKEDIQNSSTIDLNEEQKIRNALFKIEQGLKKTKSDFLNTKYKEDEDRIYHTESVNIQLYIYKNRYNNIKYEVMKEKVNNIMKQIKTLKNRIKENGDNLTLEEESKIMLTLIYFKRNRIEPLIKTINEYERELKKMRVRVFSLERLKLENELTKDISIEIKKLKIEEYRTRFSENKKNLEFLRDGWILISDISPFYYKPFVIQTEGDIYHIIQNNTILINLKQYFISLSGSTLTYTYKLLTENIREDLRNRNHITLFGHELTINADYRDIEYEIEVKAFDRYVSDGYIIKITEEEFPIIKTKNPEFDIILGNNNNYKTIINLNQDIYDGNYDYYFITQSNNNIINIDDNILEIEGYYNSNLELNDILYIDVVLKDYPFGEDYGNQQTKINIYHAPKEIEKKIFLHNVKKGIYEINLEEYNDTYFYIGSNIEIISEKQNYLLQNNILLINGDYRNETYDIIMKTNDINFITQENRYIIQIQEEKPIEPIRTENILYLNDIELYEDRIINLNQYFVSPINSTNISYISSINIKQENILINNQYIKEISYNIDHDSNLFRINGSNLIITPEYRFISYELEIIAKDDYYNISNINEKLTLLINEPRIVGIKKGFDDILEITNETVVYDLSLYYDSVTRYEAELITNIRSNNLVTNEYDIITINNSNLTIKGDFRNSNYEIRVKGINEEKENYPGILYLRVYEGIAPYPKRNIEEVIIEEKLKINEYILDIREYFDSENELEFIIRNYDNNRYEIEGYNLKIKPNVRGETKYIDIYAKDILYNVYEESEFIEIIYTEEYSIIVKNIDIPIISSNEYILHLSNIFETVIFGNILEYNYIFNKEVRQTVYGDDAVNITNQILKIIPDKRGIDYIITIFAKDPSYPSQTKQKQIYVEETDREKVKLKVEEIIINRLHKDERITYNLNNLFEDGLEYYNSEYRITTFKPNWIWINGNILNIENNEILEDIKFEINTFEENIIINEKSIKVNYLEIEDYIIENLGKEEYTFDLYNYISTKYSNIEYFGESIINTNDNILDIINVQSNILFIKPDYRGTEYELTIVMKKENISIVDYNIIVKELPLYYVNIDIPTIKEININNNTIIEINDNLRDKFTKNIDAELILSNNYYQRPRQSIYEINNEIKEPYYIDNNGIIYIYSDYRGITYDIILRFYIENYEYYDTTVIYRITESDIINIKDEIEEFTFNGLTNIEREIDVSLYYRDYIFFSKLEFEVILENHEKKEEINYILNDNLLTLYPNYLGTEYTLYIKAIDRGFNNISSNVHLIIEEELPPPLVIQSFDEQIMYIVLDLDYNEIIGNSNVFITNITEDIELLLNNESNIENNIEILEIIEGSVIVKFKIKNNGYELGTDLITKIINNEGTNYLENVNSIDFDSDIITNEKGIFPQGDVEFDLRNIATGINVNYNISNISGDFDKNNISIDNGILYVENQNRGISYDIYISIANLTQSFIWKASVIEKSLLYRNNIYKLPTILDLDHISKEYDLSKVYGTELEDEILIDVFYDYTNIGKINGKNVIEYTNNILKINPEYRNITYTIEIKAYFNERPEEIIDIIEVREKEFIRVEFIENIPINNYNLSNNTIIINFEELTKDFLYDVSYDLDCDIDISISDNIGILQANYRGIEYNIKLNAYNIDYKPETSNIQIIYNISEIKPIQKNIDFFNISNLEYIECNLDLNQFFINNTEIENISYTILKPNLRRGYYNNKEAIELENNILKIYPEYRNIFYDIQIDGYIQGYESQKETIQIRIHEKEIVPIHFIQKTIYYSNLKEGEEINIGLKENYNYPFSNFLILNSNINTELLEGRSDYNVNIFENNISIIGDVRYMTYDINIIAIDSNFGQSNNDMNIRINESAPFIKDLEYPEIGELRSRPLSILLNQNIDGLIKNIYTNNTSDNVIKYNFILSNLDEPISNVIIEDKVYDNELERERVKSFRIKPNYRGKSYGIEIKPYIEEYIWYDEIIDKLEIIELENPVSGDVISCNIELYDEIVTFNLKNLLGLPIEYELSELLKLTSNMEIIETYENYNNIREPTWNIEYTSNNEKITFYSDYTGIEYTLNLVFESEEISTGILFTIKEYSPLTEPLNSDLTDVIGNLRNIRESRILDNYFIQNHKTKEIQYELISCNVIDIENNELNIIGYHSKTPIAYIENNETLWINPDYRGGISTIILNAYIEGYETQKLERIITTEELVLPEFNMIISKEIVNNLTIYAIERNLNTYFNINDYPYKDSIRYNLKNDIYNNIEKIGSNINIYPDVRNDIYNITIEIYDIEIFNLTKKSFEIIQIHELPPIERILDFQDIPFLEPPQYEINIYGLYRKNNPNCNIIYNIESEFPNILVYIDELESNIILGTAYRGRTYNLLFDVKLDGYEYIHNDIIEITESNNPLDGNVILSQVLINNVEIISKPFSEALGFNVNLYELYDISYSWNGIKYFETIPSINDPLCNVIFNDSIIPTDQRINFEGQLLGYTYDIDVEFYEKNTSNIIYTLRYEITEGIPFIEKSNIDIKGLEEGIIEVILDDYFINNVEGELRYEITNIDLNSNEIIGIYNNCNIPLEIIEDKLYIYPEYRNKSYEFTINIWKNGYESQIMEVIGNIEENRLNNIELYSNVIEILNYNEINIIMKEDILNIVKNYRYLNNLSYNIEYSNIEYDINNENNLLLIGNEGSLEIKIEDKNWRYDISSNVIINIKPELEGEEIDEPIIW